MEMALSITRQKSYTPKKKGPWDKNDSRNHYNLQWYFIKLMIQKFSIKFQGQ